ncbi:unnamed protein product [Aphis gossypii]|uniref:Secreted protein n=1 Tax=Aphis gossypii TaxID=80765 RepID=A0A9P0IS54_APHGO|nr:unnamed protein product [Aphis gossypii]
MFCFAVILFNFDCVKAPFADMRVLNEPKNVRKVFPLFANIHHCSRSSDCLSKQRERVMYANCTISLYQTLCLQNRHRCYHRSRHCCALNSFSSIYHYDDGSIYGFPQSIEFEFFFLCIMQVKFSNM